MTRFSAYLILSAALSLAACSSTEKENQDELKGKDQRDESELFSTRDYRTDSLAVPPDLLASSNETVQANSRAAAESGDYEVLPEVVGVSIESSEDGRSWMEIDTDVEVVWRKLLEFWAYEGIELVVYNPAAGIMETDWFVRTGKSSSREGFGAVASNLFNTFSAKRTALDKFTIRLERNDSTRTRLFVTHRGTQNVATEYNNNWKDPEYKWVESGEDPEKVAQLMQTIIVLFGEQDTDPA